MSLIPKILVIDDDQAIRDGLKDFLENEGYLIQLASNGKDALEWLKRSKATPALILLDLMMPIMDGKAFLEAARQDLPGFGKIPLYLLTSASETEIPKDSGRMGILRKPMDLDDLLSILQKIIKS